MPLIITEADGSYATRVPAVLRVALTRPDGGAGPTLTLARHGQGLPRPYFPLETTFDGIGRWTITTTLDGRRVRTEVDAKDPTQLAAVPGPGDPLPKVATPTALATAGVDPICTRDPKCPFHTTSLDAAIGAGKPIALLVSTPAHCQVAICGPVLDLLVERRSKLESMGITVIHAEVYTDDSAKTTAPVVDALGMEYEPALFLARADGTVVRRLDYIYDLVELDAGLAKL